MLGEIPHLFSQLPFPKAALAVLTTFTAMAGIEVELIDLMEESSDMEKKLTALLSRVEGAIEEHHPGERGQVVVQPNEESRQDETQLGPEERQHLENLFVAAQENRTKAYELKQELDRKGIFDDYEDRFLDLFKDAGEPDDS